MENITIDDIIAKAKEYNPASDSEKIRAAMKWRKKPMLGKNVIPVSLILIILYKLPGF